MAFNQDDVVRVVEKVDVDTSGKTMCVEIGCEGTVTAASVGGACLVQFADLPEPVSLLDSQLELV